MNKMSKNDQKMIKMIKNKTLLFYVFCSLFIASLSCLNANNQNKKMDSTKVVLMGNSITESWQKDHPDFFESNSYLINKGVSGQTTVEMLVRFKKDVVDLGSNIVIILAGINDIAQNSGYISLDDIAKNITKMGLIAKASNIKVVVCSVLPVTSIEWNSKIKNSNQKVIDLNSKLLKSTKTHGFLYLDYYSSMKDELTELTYDGLHPNKSGYLKMEPILTRAIQSLLTDPN